jgi:hypothetical protein
MSNDANVCTSTQRDDLLAIAEKERRLWHSPNPQMGPAPAPSLSPPARLAADRRASQIGADLRRDARSEIANAVARLNEKKTQGEPSEGEALPLGS